MPSITARELDDDPEALNIICVSLLKYAEVKDFVDRAKSREEVEPMQGSYFYEEVESNARRLARELKERKQRSRE